MKKICLCMIRIEGQTYEVQGVRKISEIGITHLKKSIEHTGNRTCARTRAFLIGSVNSMKKGLCVLNIIQTLFVQTCNIDFRVLSAFYFQSKRKIFFLIPTKYCLQTRGQLFQKFLIIRLYFTK